MMAFLSLGAKHASSLFLFLKKIIVFFERILLRKRLFLHSILQKTFATLRDIYGTSLSNQWRVRQVNEYSLSSGGRVTGIASSIS